MPSSFGNLALSRASAARRADGSGRGWGAKFNRARSDANVVLKLGLYAGSCIAVTAGGVLDYFGSTVNTAARLEHQCRGGEVVVSDAVLADDQARAALDGRATMRGLSGQSALSASRHRNPMAPH